jgi:hypothetical protein
MLKLNEFFLHRNNVMPLIQRKMILKDFENHKLKYTMKYEFFNNFFYSFELIIQFLIFLMLFFIQLSTIDKVQKFFLKN